MRFSFILPVKNGGEYIKECVQSILAQTLNDFNLIILENKSTDGTAEWLQTLTDDRIVIFPSETSLSIEDNWARILSIPKNEYMTMTGHDDLFEPHYLQVMSDLIYQYPDASLYQTHFNYIDKNGNYIITCLPMDEKQYAHEFLASFMCRSINSTGTGYLMRSKDYEAVGGIETSYPDLIFADYALWINLSLLSYKATSLSISFKYRIHNSISKLTNGEQYQQAFEYFLNFLIKQKNKDKIQIIIERYGKTMLMYYCESLSHRILKTPIGQRRITVEKFIEKCKYYANRLIPNQDFKPLKKFKIRIAQRFDKNGFNRKFFKFIRNFFTSKI